MQRDLIPTTVHSDDPFTSPCVYLGERDRKKKEGETQRKRDRDLIPTAAHSEKPFSPPCVRVGAREREREKDINFDDPFAFPCVCWVERHGERERGREGGREREREKEKERSLL